MHLVFLSDLNCNLIFNCVVCQKLWIQSGTLANITWGIKWDFARRVHVINGKSLKQPPFAKKFICNFHLFTWSFNKCIKKLKAVQCHLLIVIWVAFLTYFQDLMFFRGYRFKINGSSKKKGKRKWYVSCIDD